MSSTGRHIAVVGAGIVGLAVARTLQQRVPGATVTVVEKEPAVARHQTGHNSGVAHAGLYYQPGSMKVTLCRRGLGMLKAYCEEHDLPYDERGKLVVALSDHEVGRLRDIERRATVNGVEGLAWLSGVELRDLEPNVAGVAALHSPKTAIVDYVAISRSLQQDVVAAGGEVTCDVEVTGIDIRPSGVIVSSPNGEITVDTVLVCAGLQSDRVARLVGAAAEPAIVPFRGEYYRLVPEAASLVRRLIYPVPDPRYPFLGVHFTPRVDGSVDIGPNAVLALSREGYRWRDASLRGVAEIVRTPGFAAMAQRHWRTGVREVTGSLSKKVFVARARSFVPSLQASDVVVAQAGVRAQALDRAGELVDDFTVEVHDPVVLVRNAPSPAATSSFAIAEAIVDRVVAMRAP